MALVPAKAVGDEGFFVALLSRQPCGEGPQTAAGRKLKGVQTMKDNNIPYKIYLNEDEMPRTWYRCSIPLPSSP